MATKTLAAAALAATILSAMPAMADGVPTTLWTSDNHWTVAWDPLMRGCFIEAQFQHSQMTLRFGTILRGQDNMAGYLTLRNAAWASFQPGQTYTVMLSIDNIPPQAWTGSVMNMTDGTPELYFETNNAKFIDMMKAGSSISISYNGQVVQQQGSLAGSTQAIASMAQCQMAYTPEAFNRRPSDPFQQTAPAVRRDPFRGV